MGDSSPECYGRTCGIIPDAPELIVTKPTNTFAPVPPVIPKVPVMFVAPFAVKARVLVLSVPDVMVRVPLTMVAKPSVAVFDALLIVRL